jgi:hypothetical protein
MLWPTEHGNVTTYEWKYGEPPLKVEEPPLNIEFEDEADDTSADDNAVSMSVCSCNHPQIHLLERIDCTEQRLA